MKKKVLFICKAGKRRSLTAAKIFSESPYNFDTLAVGAGKFAEQKVTDESLSWADEVVCMNKWQLELVAIRTNKDVCCFDIPDKFEYMDDQLVKMLKQKYKSMED